MKSIFSLVCFAFFLAGCQRAPDTVWDDTKSATRYMERGFRSLGGKQTDSRQVQSRNEFMCPTQEPCYMEESPPSDYIPLSDDPNVGSLEMRENRPPKETPGEPGSSIPGISAFRDPHTNPQWAPVFRNVEFAYNSSLVKGADNLQTIRNIADNMRQNPRLYLFVEGHCDERGPEAYNLALGSHRANAVRNLLINEGISPDRLFTISYGKERPIVLGQDEESWQQNRRAEFKIYER